MSEDVAEVCRQCEQCDRANAVFNARAPQLSPLPIMGFGYRWAVDLAGPFKPTSKRGNKYIMVCVEYFTKHERVLSRFASCAEVVTDQGTEWGAEFEEQLQAWFIDHRVTSPNHPSADGLAERTVQTFKRALRKYCEAVANAEQWDDVLPWIVLGYNCSVQTSTRMSPYYMLYARHPVIPPAIVERFAEPVDVYDVEAAAQLMLARAELAQKISLQGTICALHNTEISSGMLLCEGVATYPACITFLLVIMCT